MMTEYQLDCAAAITGATGILVNPDNFDRFEEWLRFNMPELCFSSDDEATAAVLRRRQRMLDAGYFRGALPSIPARRSAS